MKMFANKQNPIDFIEAGDIGAAVGFKEIKQVIPFATRITRSPWKICSFRSRLFLLRLSPKTQADVDRMGMAIGKLVEEDPTLRVKTDEETGQTILSGMGELHLEIIVDRMRREFKVEVNQGAPQVAYKEAFQATIEHREVLKKQTGGRGKFADIVFEMGPVEKEWKAETRISIFNL
jgi:elongation factor G